MNDSLLFTGASGFLGNNILPRLRRDYYSVTTLGHLPDNDISVDLSTEIPTLPRRFNIVLHAAGKAHTLPKTKQEEDLFYAVNCRGTANLCKALENAGVPEALIFISTVAVYGRENGILIDEAHPLNGTSPYAKSKIMAEKYLTQWCTKHGVTLTILRPSLLAGLNPPGNLGDMIKGIRKGFYVNISRGNIRKSIMMAEDIANLLPLVKSVGGIYNVCDTEHPSFGQLSRLIATQLGKRPPVSIPYWAAKCMAIIGDVAGKRFPVNSKRLDKLTQSLTFSNTRAMESLGWTPLMVMEHLKIN